MGKIPPKRQVDLVEDSKDVSLGTKVEAPPPPTPDLKFISGLGLRYLLAKAKVTQAEKALAEAKAELYAVSYTDLPTAMDQVGMADFTTLDGSRFVVEDFVDGSIPKDNAADAYKWLRDKGHGGIIKRFVSVAFGKGEDERAQKFIEIIQKSKLPFEDESSVHHMTLKAWAREMQKHGKPFPTDLLGLFLGRRAVLK